MCMATTISSQVALFRGSTVTEESKFHKGLSSGHVPHTTQMDSFQVSRRQSTTCVWYKGLFGTLFVQQKRQHTSFDDARILSDEVPAKTETLWIFLPSFLSRCISFQSINACGSIQRSFRTYPLIAHDHPIWDMCRHGDIMGIQSVFSQRTTSPFCVNKFGKTLLHVRTHQQQRDIIF